MCLADTTVRGPTTNTTTQSLETPLFSNNKSDYFAKSSTMLLKYRKTGDVDKALEEDLELIKHNLNMVGRNLEHYSKVNLIILKA